MQISVFLSYPKPHTLIQDAFVKRLYAILESRSLYPRTLGATDYNMDAPLASIRALMVECNGLIALALRRTRIDSGTVRPDANLPGPSPEVPGPTPTPISGEWLTSPWCHIEPAMAFQLGLPILLIRESGVVADGVFEKGVIGQYMPTVNIPTSPLELENYFSSGEFSSILGQWEAFVRRVHRSKGQVPSLWQ